MNEIQLGGKTFKLSLSMRAARQFHELTGINFVGNPQVIFDKVLALSGNTIDPDLFCKFIYVAIVDGLYPTKPDFSLDDVCHWIKLFDQNIALAAYVTYMTQQTGKTMDEINETIKKKLEEATPQTDPIQ